MNRLATLILLCALAGCGGPTLGTVTGNVTFDGQPLEKGTIQLVPVSGNAQTAGEQIVGGKFTIKNVPLGPMRVEIQANKVVGQIKVYDAPDSPLRDDVRPLIPAKYNTESQEVLDVKAGPQTVQYDLTSK